MPLTTVDYKVAIVGAGNGAVMAWTDGSRPREAPFWLSEPAWMAEDPRREETA
jgi:hypothetical protein